MVQQGDSEQSDCESKASESGDEKVSEDIQLLKGVNIGGKRKKEKKEKTKDLKKKLELEEVGSNFPSDFCEYI